MKQQFAIAILPALVLIACNRQPDPNKILESAQAEQPAVICAVVSAESNPENSDITVDFTCSNDGNKAVGFISTNLIVRDKVTMTVLGEIPHNINTGLEPGEKYRNVFEFNGSQEPYNSADEFNLDIKYEVID